MSFNYCRGKYEKYINYCVIIFLIVTSSVTAQWNRQSPQPTHLDVRGIGAPSATHVFIATDDNSFDNGGSLFESTDGGISWTQLNIPVSLGEPLNGMFFLDSQHGWVYGNANYRTIDGGNTWTQLPVLGSIYFMKFFSPTLGIATSNLQRYITFNGGDTWSQTPNGIFSLDFINNGQIGLGASETGIYRTTDGAATFTPVYTGNAKAAAFLSTTNAAAIADNNFMYSTDSGAAWTTAGSANGKTKLLTVSPNVILAWGRTGTFPNYDNSIYRSSDAGQTWTDIGEVIPAGIFAFRNIDPQNIAAADLDGNMYLSSDSGLTWALTFTSTGQSPGYLSSAVPYFTDIQTGYFGYGDGFVIKTTDGGSSWFQISSGTGISLNDIARFSNGNMIAVGDDGTLLTSNGSSPWIIRNQISEYDLKAVHIIGESEAAVLDELGFVYFTTDRGNSWTGSTSAPSSLNPAEDLDFNSLLEGWVIGQASIGEVLYHTTNGGNSWIQIPTSFGGAYISVDQEGSNVWALNASGSYAYSHDNGTTWTQGFFVDAFQVSDIDFYDESTGYAVGWGGFAARSTDGGISWQVLGTPNEDDKLSDIYLVGPNELWISTYDDAAYYSANGGVNWAVLQIGSAGFGNFSAITASPEGNAWTAGYQGYIEHFNGPPPPPPNRPPEASFEFSNLSLTVDFTDTSIDPDGIIVSWRWDFGDGNTSTEQNPTHIYDTSGIYLARLTVTDNDGDSSTAGRSVVVQEVGVIYGNFIEVTPLDSLFVTPHDEDFIVMTTAPGDYDNDGDLDIAVLGYYVIYNQSYEDKLVLIRNDGPADSTRWKFSYIDVPLGDLTPGASDIVWGDMDSDDDLDLVVGTNGETVIYRNDNGTLVLSDTELPGYDEYNDEGAFDLNSISWVDFDNDGDFDLLIPSVFDDTSFTYRTALMRNDSSNGTGGRVFTEVNAGLSPTSHAQSSWADFDHDQDLDLLLVNLAPLTDEGFIRRYRNDGNGVFIGEDILGTLTVEHGEVQWGDYDADGDIDILVAGNIKDTTGTYLLMALRIYDNINDNFVSRDVIGNIPGDGWYDLTAATWADYDSDGSMDILLAGTHNPGTGQIEGRAQIYSNDGNGNFLPTESELPAPRAFGSWGGTFSWFDIDEEGDLDYFIAGGYFVPGGNGLIETQMHIYRNDVPERNDAPTPPSDLAAVVQPDKTVQLTWTASTDDNTPAPAITYDIVVRKGTHNPTIFGGIQPITARLPEPGNISAVTEWTLKGLPDGQYQWFLRAVDAAYVGGTPASGEFSIGVPTSVDDDNKPVVYSLEQNYPNPFNPATTIRYSIQEETFVKLTIYNLLGEQQFTLVNKVQPAGIYDVEFNAGDLASGIYIYRIEAGDFKSTKKLMLLK